MTEPRGPEDRPCRRRTLRTRRRAEDKEALAIVPFAFEMCVFASVTFSKLASPSCNCITASRHFKALVLNDVVQRWHDPVALLASLSLPKIVGFAAGVEGF